MNTLEILKSYYNAENVKLENGVYKCVKKESNGKPYQIAYVDHSNKWLEKDANRYIESIITNDYYNDSNYLQWNYYYYFISPDEIISSNNNIKKDIETDESYARKFVMRESEFEEWLASNKKINLPSTDSIRGDLYSIWVNELRKHNFNFICDDSITNIKKTVEDFLENNKIYTKEKDLDQLSYNNSANELGQIRKLSLKKYRKYPERNLDNPSFDLGQVVLISGPNAAGKTSFLDAIELIITGTCSRNENVMDYELELTDDKNHIFSFPDKQKPYKNRDYEWYKNFTARGHNLNGNFNRFNYYTSDAAFELKQNDDDKDENLENIIADIALGKEVNKLEERINSFQKKFSEYNSSYNKDLQRLKYSFSQKKFEYRKYKHEISNPPDYQNNIESTLKQRKWKLNVETDINDFILKMDPVINIVTSYISIIKDHNFSLNNSYSFAIKELKELNALQLSVNNNKKNIFDAQQSLLTKNKELESLTVLKSNLDELNNYYTHPKFEDFIGITKKIESKTNFLNYFKNTEELYRELPITTAFLELYKEKTINQIEEDLNSKRTDIQKNQKELINTIDQLEDGINKLAKIANDISGYGKEYLKLVPNATSCPLCETHFESNSLADAINSAKGVFANSDVLLDLKAKRQENANKIVLLEIDNNALLELKRLSFSLIKENQFEATLSTIIETFNRLEKESQSVENELLSLKNILNEFDSKKLSENRFNELKNNLEKSVNKEIKNYIDFLSVTEDTNNKTSEIRFNINTLIKNIEKFQDDSQTLFSNKYPTETDIIKGLNNYQEINNSFLNINEYIAFEKEESLFSIIENVNHIESIFDTYRKAFLLAQQTNKAIEILKSDLKDITAQIRYIQPRQIRAEKGFTILSNILSENDKNEYLKEYINHNRKEIVEFLN